MSTCSAVAVCCGFHAGVELCSSRIKPFFTGLRFATDLSEGLNLMSMLI